MWTFNPYAYRALKKALREFNPDIVHLHTLGAASPSVLFALRNTPTVATVHGPEGYTRDLVIWNLPKTDFKDEDYDVGGLTRRGKMRLFYYRYINYPLYRRGFRNVDRVVTISTYIRNIMDAQGMRSTYVPNGVKMFDFVPLTEATLNHTVVFAGRLEKVKGVEHVLRALPKVIARFPDTRFLIAGTGKDEEDLHELAHSLSLDDHVTFLGHIRDRRDMQELYGRSTVIVVPSIWPEVSSRGGIESMSVGRPIIASRVGGLTDWLHHGKTGYLVPPSDPSALAGALIKIFGDPAANVAMGTNARKMAETYDMALHAQRIEQVYHEVLHEKRKAHV
jgi:glycosyltransferase involved in cell wall biosynthesis